MSRSRRRSARRAVLPVAVALAALGGGAPPAGAAAPTMPLADVQPGMRCTAQTVVRGTDIATFDIEILDIVAGDSAARSPYILFRASGPAVDATGVGPGFSGSPITCPDAAGTPRVAGAISEGIGAYGNLVALATPIELILGEPVDAPAQTRVARDLVRGARPLALPLSVSGLRAPVAAALRTAARRIGRAVYAAPAAPLGARFGVQTLRVGSAVAAGLSSGDVTAGAIGTVAYVDGDRVWAFGHPLDGAGRRSLFLQDAYVYAVIGNPTGSADLSTYKFAAAGHALGTLTNDATSAVVGRVGALPASFPLKVTGTDLDTGAVRVANVRIADETALGLPTGTSALTQVGALTLSNVAYDVLRGIPLRQSGSMCVRITVRELKKPLGFCNTYSGGTQATSPGAPQLADFVAATAQLDAYNFGPLHVTGAAVDLKLRRSLRQAFLLGVDAPARVRRGSTVRLRVRAERVGGGKLSLTVPVRIPLRTPLGERRLRLDGTPADAGTTLEDALGGVLDLSALLEGTDDPTGGTGPRTPAVLARRIAAVGRYDGLYASLPPLSGAASLDEPLPSGGEGVAQTPLKAYRDPGLRLSGVARTRVVVVR